MNKKQITCKVENVVVVQRVRVKLKSENYYDDLNLVITHSEFCVTTHQGYKIYTGTTEYMV